jgi:hypothetical protein
MQASCLRQWRPNLPQKTIVGCGLCPSDCRCHCATSSTGRGSTIMNRIIEANFLLHPVEETEEKPRILLIDDSPDSLTPKLAPEKTRRYLVWEQNNPARTRAFRMPPTRRCLLLFRGSTLSRGDEEPSSIHQTEGHELNKCLELPNSTLRPESFKESSFPLLSSVTALFPCIRTKGNKGSDDNSIGN